MRSKATQLTTISSPIFPFPLTTHLPPIFSTAGTNSRQEKRDRSFSPSTASPPTFSLTPNDLGSKKPTLVCHPFPPPPPSSPIPPLPSTEREVRLAHPASLTCPLYTTPISSPRLGPHTSLFFSFTCHTIFSLSPPKQTKEEPLSYPSFSLSPPPPPPVTGNNTSQTCLLLLSFYPLSTKTPSPPTPPSP